MCPPAQVECQDLMWSSSSFVEARLTNRPNIFVQDLASVLRRKRGRPRKDRGQRAGGLPPIEALEPSQSSEAESEDSDESDESILEALAKVLVEMGAEPEDPADEPSQEAAERRELKEVEICRLSTSVASKYVDKKPEPATSSSPPVVPTGVSTAGPSSKSQGPPKSTEAKEAVHKFEEVIAERAVRDAVQAISSQKQSEAFPANLEKSMREANEAHGGLLLPEEEAEEGLLELAQPIVDAPEATHCAPLISHDQMVERWAKQLATTARAFQAEAGKFFQDVAMSSELHRSISLVQFMEEVPVADSEGQSNEAEGDGDTTLVTSMLQFVHWDSPEAQWGRRLRIEQGRFVWKPPGKVAAGVSEDDLRPLFSDGMARIVIHDIGAALVKARGMFRTDVPPNVLRIYKALSIAVQTGNQENTGEFGFCFLCKEQANTLCPLCQLWSHSHCCFALAAKISGVSNEPSTDDVGEAELPVETHPAVASAYGRGSGAQSELDTIAGLVDFESSDLRRPCRDHLFIRQASCLLCRALLALADSQS